jgi:mRNA-degrading endonuclease YafQ of YafQ-DinJ toxin-antitoxin module
MKTQVWNNSFKWVIKRNPQLGEKIFSVWELLVNDPFSPSLKAHKLRGQ